MVIFHSYVSLPEGMIFNNLRYPIRCLLNPNRPQPVESQTSPSSSPGAEGSAFIGETMLGVSVYGDAINQAINQP